MRRSREAERIGRRVAALEPYLVRSQSVELARSSARRATARRRRGSSDLRHPALDSIGIELRVPGRVQRVREYTRRPSRLNSDHLRSAVERFHRPRRVWRAFHDPAQRDTARQPRVERIEHVVAQQLARSPARHVQPVVVHGQVDVRHERRHGAEPLEQRRKIVRRRRSAPGCRSPCASSSFAVCRCPCRDTTSRRTTRDPRATSRRRRSRRRATGCAPAAARASSDTACRARALRVNAAAKIPHVERVAVFPGEQQFRVHAVLHHVRRSPLAR